MPNNEQNKLSAKTIFNMYTLIHGESWNKAIPVTERKERIDSQKSLPEMVVLLVKNQHKKLW